MPRNLPAEFWDYLLLPILVLVTAVVEDLRQRADLLIQERIVYGTPAPCFPKSPPADLLEMIQTIVTPTVTRLAVVDVALRRLVSFSDEVPIAYRLDPIRSQTTKQSMQGRIARWRRNLIAWHRRQRCPATVFWGTYNLDGQTLRHFARDMEVRDLGYPDFKPTYPTASPETRREVFASLVEPYRSVLALLFPVAALEGLPVTLQAARQEVRSLRRRVRRVLTCGYAFWEAEWVRAAVGLLLGEGTAVLDLQHGGGYGTYATTVALEAEIRSSSSFCSWGWSADKYPTVPLRVVPLPSPYLSNLPRPSARRPRWQVLLLLQSDHLYPKHIHNPVFAEFAPEYFRRETNLLGYLAGLTGVAVKLCPVEFGWGQNAWIAAAYPTIELLHYGRFPKLACFARCCIVDYNSTGFLELLAMNRPFLATWDRHWWRGPVAFEQHLDALMECGVFHDSPTHLTRTHMQVGADIETWWAEPRRQQAVKAMARSYAWATPDWLEHWRRFLSGGPGSRSVPPVYALPNNQ